MVDKGHGRRERRTVRTTPLLTVGQRWRGLKQGFELTRERTIHGVTTVEVVYGITSLSGDRGAAATVERIVRDHWGIENRLHHVRDETLGEDACRVRSGAAPQVLAAIRNTVVHLLSSIDATSRIDAQERLQLDPDRAYKLLGIPQTE